MTEILHADRLLQQQGPIVRHLRHVLAHIHDRVLVASGLMLVIGPGRTDDGIALSVGIARAIHRGKAGTLEIVVNRYRVVPVVGDQLARMDQLDTYGDAERRAGKIAVIVVDRAYEAPPAEAVGADEEEGLLPTLRVQTRASSPISDGPPQERPDQMAFF